MYSFESDYNNGCHPSILSRLAATNDLQTDAYGFDRFSESAKQRIREACECPNANVFFLGGGTQTNATVIDSILQSYQGVVAAETAHIATHESGAIEFGGHKVITLPQHEGKISATDLRNLLVGFYADDAHEHIVFPGMVYITFPTEYGTLYTASELLDIESVCHEYHLPLFVDGARLGYGLTSPASDISLPFLAHHCDVFYIGGTKVGAFCGEAVVFTHGNANPHFFSIIKQHGALFAKGRLIGIQFDTLFTDNLYLSIARHANELAVKLKQILKDKGFKTFIDSPTNQQFFILPNDVMDKLSQHIAFSRWAPFDAQSTVCRFVTSWSTTDADLQLLEKCLDDIVFMH